MNRSIVGISLVRNEDIFIARVLQNARSLCDTIIVADHGSTDKTADIVQNMAITDAGIQYEKITNAGKSHDLIRGYANTPTWIFPVDGDEIYDPAGLTILRQKILGGELEAYRQCYGNVLHCVELDENAGIAKGYLSPPSRSMTKLYNFGALYDWEGPCLEKCLGGRIHFKEGYSENSNLLLQNKMTWEDSYFRCLHMVFLRRSSSESSAFGARANVVEIYGNGILGVLKHRVREITGRLTASKYKGDQYRRGDLVEKPIESFWGSNARILSSSSLKLQEHSQ